MKLKRENWTHVFTLSLYNLYTDIEDKMFNRLLIYNRHEIRNI